MRKAWLALIFVFSALLLALCLAAFWYGSQKEDSSAYILRDEGGRVAVYHAGAEEPKQVYDIYTHLLPPEDTQKLQQGIPVETEAQLQALLEDLGL